MSDPCVDNVEGKGGLVGGEGGCIFVPSLSPRAGESRLTGATASL